MIYIDKSHIPTYKKVVDIANFIGLQVVDKISDGVTILVTSKLITYDGIEFLFDGKYYCNNKNIDRLHIESERINLSLMFESRDDLTIIPRINVQELDHVFMDYSYDMTFCRSFKFDLHQVSNIKFTSDGQFDNYLYTYLFNNLNLSNDVYKISDFIKTIAPAQTPFSECEKRIAKLLNTRNKNNFPLAKRLLSSLPILSSELRDVISLNHAFVISVSNSNNGFIPADVQKTNVFYDELCQYYSIEPYKCIGSLGESYIDIVNNIDLLKKMDALIGTTHIEKLKKLLLQ